VRYRYDIAGAEDLEFERLWLPLKGIVIDTAGAKIGDPDPGSEPTQKGTLKNELFINFVKLNLK
jgi:hypothetical protein